MLHQTLAPVTRVEEEEEKIICRNQHNITVKYKYRNTQRATIEAKTHQMLAALLTHTNLTKYGQHHVRRRLQALNCLLSTDVDRTSPSRVVLSCFFSFVRCYFLPRLVNKDVYK